MDVAASWQSAQAALALWASEREAAIAEPRQAPPPPVPATGKPIRIAHHRYDDSVFIDGRLVVRGGEPVLVNKDQILREAQKAAENLWERARASV